MRAYYKIGLAAAFGLTVAAGAVFATNIFDITYPIAELGGCESQSACKDYCDKPENGDACQAFAEAKGLVKKTEKKVVVDERKKGPGGCTVAEDCLAYCNDPAHTEECIDFAEREGLMSIDAASRARASFKKRAGLSEGPGGCKNETECHNYCDNDANFDECMKYAEEHNLMSEEAIERARKFRGKDGPGGCKGGRACKDYCETSGHEEECLEFAEKEGLLPKEEVERARKFMSAVKEKPGPGGCKGRDCEKYCFDPAHREECFNFAKENNLLDEEELKNIERGRKLEEKVREVGGPGGCRDEEACMDYCKDPAHVEECLGFASAHGGMDTEDAKLMLEEFVERSSQVAPQGPLVPGPFRKPPGEFGPQQGELDEKLRRFQEFEKFNKQFLDERGERFGPSPDQQGRPFKAGPPAGGFKPESRPFEGGVFRPEGGPFEEDEFQPHDRPFEEGGPPQRPNTGSPPEGNVMPRPEEFRMQDGMPEQQFRQEYQRQYEQQFQQQYREQMPSVPEGGAFGVPPPPPSAPEQAPPPPPPAALRSVSEAVANVIFAPVRLIESLLR